MIVQCRSGNNPRPRRLPLQREPLAKRRRCVLFLAVLALVFSTLGVYAACFDPLLPLLVDLPGWEAEAADDADASASGVRAVTAYRTYESAERWFRAKILAGMQAGINWLLEY